MDQIAAGVLGKDTALPSLEIGLDVPVLGSCDFDWSCVYVNTITWRTPTTPVPMETNPRVVFERLFGEADTTDRTARLARIASRRSILDSLAESLAELQQGLGARDRGKVAEYLDAVRDVERQIQRAEAQSHRELPSIDRPTEAPVDFARHARLMFDLQVLAYQTDVTRVITFMMGRELSGRSFPEIQVHDAHHPTSHHQGDRAKLKTLARINRHHVAQFAYFLERLRSTADGDGSLLDHLTIVYGGGMSDGNSHSPDNLPVLIAGGGAGALQGGRHLRFAPDTPIANLHATLLPKLEIDAGRFGNSTGTLSGV
jgi:hypothetical protein